MIKQGSLAIGIAAATLLCGPIFIATTAIGYACAQFPSAIRLENAEWLILLMIPAIMYGSFVGVLPIIFGAMAMAAIASKAPVARLPALWTFAGAICGAGIMILFRTSEPDTAATFGVIATSAICARICRHWVEWEDKPGSAIARADT